MPIDVEITPGLDGEIEQAVARQRFEHVVEEADPRFHPSVALPIQIYPDVKIGLIGFS
jgi:hypothetical protein